MNANEPISHIPATGMSYSAQKGSNGLTKYEHMCIEFTKALLSNSDMTGRLCIDNAIMLSDLLIEKLNEKK